SSLTPHPPPAPTLFPYTTLFRSGEAVDHRSGEVRGRRPGAGIDGLGDLLPVDGHGNRLSPQPAGLTGEVRVLHVYREGPVPGGGLIDSPFPQLALEGAQCAGSEG